MAADNYPRYYNSIVQICRAAPNLGQITLPDYVGAGVIVDNRTIITCAHVVADALGQNQGAKGNVTIGSVVPVKRIFVDGYDTAIASRNARLIIYNERMHGNELADIAVLQLVEGSFNISETYKTSDFEIIEQPVGQKVSALGFPRDAAATITQSVPAFYEISSHAPNGWFNATSGDITGDEIRPGFSGSPVMDRQSGAIAGIICEADSGRRTANIIPAQLLQKIYALPLKKPADKYSTGDPQQVVHKEISFERPRLRRFLEKMLPGFHYFLTVKVPLLKDIEGRAEIQRIIAHKRADLINDLKDKTYIPSPSKQIGETSVQQQYQQDGDRFLLPIHQLIKAIAGESTGGDSSSAQISALSKKSKRVRNLVNLLLKAEKPIIILGEPGSGKSLTLKQVALDLCRKNEKRVFPSVCLFIPLGGWVPVKKPGINDVEKLVEANLPAELKPYKDKLIEQRRLVIIFDGLDEMSREQYVPHTEALSKYADAYDGLRTLFSCRIADFSPAFRHHRMVLMPFERNHIRSYLERQFGKENLYISGENISISELAKRLLYSDLPVLPQNPFSLWLLSLYIREKQIWPESRAELLYFSFEYQYKLKTEDTPQNTILPETVVFDWWSKLAFEITTRNKGTDIGLHEVRGLFGPDAEKVISLGRNCGVLQQSLGEGHELVRFAHHRAQEFFTAYYIVQANPEMHWDSYLDIPRWQETLIFVTQMKGGLAPLAELTESLEKAPEFLSQIAENKGELIKSEAIIAERVELSSRVAKVIPKDENSDTFAQTLRTVVLWLAQNGNAATQVKMLNAVKLMPHANLYEVVVKLRQSNINWVRENADIVAAHISRKPQASDIPEDAITAYGDGSILKTLPRRLRLAKRIGSNWAFALNSVVALVFLCQIIAMASVFPVLSYFAANLMVTHYKFALFVNWMPLTVSAVTIVVAVWSMVFRPYKTWQYTMGASCGTLVLSILLLALWKNSELITYQNLAQGIFYIAIGGYSYFHIVRYIIAFIAILIWGIFTGILAFIMLLFSNNNIFKRTYSIAWSSTDFGEYIENILPLILFAGGGFGLVFLLIYIGNTNLITYLKKIIFQLPLVEPGFSLFIIILFLIGVLVFAIINILFVLRPRNNYWAIANYPLYLSGVAIFFYFSIVFFRFIAMFLSYILELIPSASASGMIKLIIYALAIGAFIALCWLLVPVCKYLARLIWVPVKLPTTKEEFKAAIKKHNAIKQEQLLILISPSMLKITDSAFYDLLIDVEHDIKEDPAKGKYFEKIAQVQEILRQGRIG